ncbi:hypothetical protein BM221_007292 [Beauveria bassiana]|uniref:Uncharacterized protein n=1 Tax=Beauveria bassiana TaxID=176275 RepID=A0A2N6NG93_BEABA|nr:hypothetical protein BM221_007292 [Beauveria bassiana]
MALLHKNCGYQQEAASLSQDYVFRLATKTRRRVAVEFLAESEMELNGDDRRLQLASPLILHWGYEALAYFADSVRNESNTDADVALGAARKAMERLNLRWKAAGMKVTPTYPQEI